MIENEIVLPGKMVFSGGYGSNEYLIYVNSESAIVSIELKNNREVEYSGLIWLNTEDNFLCSEIIPGRGYFDYRINIVKVDLKGKVIDTLYIAEKGELAWVRYPSWNDEYLLFTTHKKMNPDTYHFEGLTPMLCLNIMDLKQKKVITKIDSIGRSPNFELNESPWLIDREHFVYSLSEETTISYDGEVYNSLGDESPGVYKYSLKSGKSSLLVPDATTAIASPVNNEISYVKENSVYSLDLNNNLEKLIYNVSNNKQIVDLHYTPDGQMIYIVVRGTNIFGNPYTMTENLIEISTGKEIKFKKIRDELSWYSWK